MLTNTYLDKTRVKIKYKIEQGEYLCVYYQDCSGGWKIWRLTIFKNGKSIINETLAFPLTKEEVKEKLDYHLKFIGK